MAGRGVLVRSDAIAPPSEDRVDAVRTCARRGERQEDEAINHGQLVLADERWRVVAYRASASVRDEGG